MHLRGQLYGIKSFFYEKNKRIEAYLIIIRCTYISQNIDIIEKILYIVIFIFIIKSLQEKYYIICFTFIYKHNFYTDIQQLLLLMIYIS